MTSVWARAGDGRLKEATDEETLICLQVCKCKYFFLVEFSK